MITVKIICKNPALIPQYKTIGAAGADICADITENIVLKPLQRVHVPTGLYMEIPEGYECQLRPRSGLALKEGLGMVNAPGTIDSDYRGEVGALLVNLSDKDITVTPGERIGQMVFARYERADFIRVDKLEDTERSQGGFGHTGK